ncbi:MAG: hypothetical protein U1E52_17295 [Geminicoccaceae bacterium]
MTIHQASCTWSSRRARPFWAAAIGLALGFGLCALAPAAKAEIVSLSATGFVRHCPCVEDGTQESNTHDGVLEFLGQNNTFYAAVDFPTEGQKICSLALVYRDVNGNDAIRARLFKKSFTNGGNPFAAPTVVATATSATGVPATVRIAKTTTINQPTVAQANAFYYVLVDGPTINLAFLGVQIDVKKTC